ncbi:MAG: acyl-CoA carboxylase subunit epsilon [Geodermatophilaceae bacterium]|nr:acyl-CoA carboxylase subunit epsilon [Geodermatophilaceae bacterium]
MESEPESSPPFLRIVRGEPNVEEVAALVAVLSVASQSRRAAVTPPAFGWSARSRFVRAPLRAGHDGWRASSLVR